MEKPNFSTEKLLRGYLQTFQKDLKADTIIEYFVPSGTKDSQKIKRASISLQVLVSHFSTSYQPQDDSKLDSKQQTYLLTTIQKFIISLLKSYTIQDFYDSILKNEEVELRERYSQWKEFIGLICSIPERSANLMALDQKLGYKEENTFLNEAKLFDKFTTDSETLIYNKSGRDDLEEDEIKMLVFACAELFSKICRIGHSKILVQTMYSKLLNRLHNSTSYIYYKIWKKIISSFSSHTIELFLTAFLLHSQSRDLSKITNPVSTEDKSRYLVRKVATLLSLLIEKDNKNASYLIKFKYFVGGKIFPISIVRVLCCSLSRGEFQGQHDDKLQKIIDQIDNLKLKVNDDLLQVLKTLISSWSDPTFIKHASNSTQIYLTSAILIIFGYLPKSTLINAAISREITPGITQWLQNTSEETRKLGMVTAEMLSKLTDVSENVLDFGLNPEDEDVKYLRQLVELKDGIVDLPDIDYEDKVEETILEETSYHEDIIINEQEFAISQNEVKSEDSAEIENDSEARIVDSDDEDDFVPYPMKEESDEDEDDVESLPQTKKKKILTPVYIIDLLSYLKVSDDPDKLAVAMNAAEKLIREKTDFGTELDEHAAELVRILIGLQDNFDLKEFEENRHAAIVALICGSPKIAVPFITQQFFEKKYSLAERYMILSALSTGARELAGLQVKKSIDDKKKNTIMDTLSQELNYTPIKTLKGTNSDKVRRFSRKPLVESMRTTSVNRFNELAAKTFFFPLTAGFWNLTRDRNRSNFMNDPTLVQKYVTTLGVFVQCSTNTISLSQITREYWDLIFSLRFFDDPAVLSSILFGIGAILNTLSERELAESFGKELIETQQWATTIFENKINEQVQSMAAWVLVKIKEIVKEYQVLLMGNLLPLT